MHTAGQLAQSGDWRTTCPRAEGRDATQGTWKPRARNQSDRASADVATLEVSGLVALVLTRERGHALRRARELVTEVDLTKLSRATPGALLEQGLSPRESLRLAAAFELGRRVEMATIRPRRSLRSPERVFALMAPQVRGLAQESFHVLLLDGKHRLQRCQRVSEGTLTSSLVHPREVFGPAVREGAAAVIVVHNHPSGDPEPSNEDIAVTRRLIDVGRLLGVPLLDHVVVADAAYVSLRERLGFNVPD